MKEPAWHYMVSNQYGFNQRIHKGNSLTDPAPRGSVVNVPRGMLSRDDMGRLCERLAKCGVVHFDMDALYRTPYYPNGREAFSSLMQYIYPCVKKHGVDVFSNKDVYHGRNFIGGPAVTIFDLEARRRFKAPPHDDHYDATPYIGAIQSILNKETTVSNEAPKFDDQTGAPLPQAYESRILTGEELKPGRMYTLEVVGGKNTPDIAAAGVKVVALADSEGNYTRWVRLIDDTERTFEVDYTDLFLKN